MPSTLFTTIPNSSEFAFKVARKKEGIDDTLTNEQALAMIDPATIALILQIVQQVIACMSNNKSQSMGRIRSFLSGKLMDKLGDQMRLHTIINSWATCLGVQRESGDVVAIREAIVFVAQELDENKLGQIQTELLWMTV